jgi:hypothetical protein
MLPTRKQRVVDLLKSLETKASAPLAFINPDKYIQHNLRVGPGLAGVTALIKNLPPEATVDTIRVFETAITCSLTPSTTSSVLVLD